MSNYKIADFVSSGTPGLTININTGMHAHALELLDLRPGESYDYV